MDQKVIPINQNVAELFAAPEMPGEAAVKEADPLNQLDEAARDLARLRLMPVNEIVQEYLGTRDHLDDERHKWQAIETNLKDKLMRMSMVMREKADSLGVDAFPIRGVGTAYRSVKVSLRVSDWESYWKFLIENNLSQCVEKRPAKLAVLEVTSAMGQLPPGLEKIEEVEFLVRRTKA